MFFLANKFRSPPSLTWKGQSKKIQDLYRLITVKKKDALCLTRRYCFQGNERSVDGEKSFDKAMHEEWTKLMWLLHSQSSFIKELPIPSKPKQINEVTMNFGWLQALLQCYAVIW